MTINEFRERYKLQFDEVDDNHTDHLYSLSLLDKRGGELIPEYRREFCYSKLDLREDIIKQEQGMQIGPFSSVDDLKKRSKRILVQKLFNLMEITDFCPLDESNDLDFLFD